MIDYELSDLFLQNSINKQMVLSTNDGTRITNSMIHQGSFVLEESLCSESTITIGSCEANSIKFTYSTESTISLKDKWLDVEMSLGGNTNMPFKYGRYKVFSDVPTSDRKARNIVAYDVMYDIINADVTSWFNGLTFPMTLKDFRDSFFAYLGVDQVDTSLIHDGILIEQGIQAEKISGKTVICSICEANGCFGNINRQGKFKYKYLDKITQGLVPSNDLFPSNDLYPSDFSTYAIGNSAYIYCNYEDFKTMDITGLYITKQEDSAGVLVGTEDNCYKITNNFLFNGMSEEQLTNVANNIYEKIKDISYIPVTSSDCLGNPCLEVGDAIRFNTSKKLVETYILNRTLSGIQALRDSYVAHGTLSIAGNVNSVYDAITDLKGKTNVLERTAEETKSTLTNLEENVSSEFRQTAQQISLKVSKGNVSSEISQEAGQVTISGNRLVVNSTNFSLDAQGNVDITGDLKTYEKLMILKDGYSAYIEGASINDDAYLIWHDSDGTTMYGQHFVDNPMGILFQPYGASTKIAKLDGMFFIDDLQTKDGYADHLGIFTLDAFNIYCNSLKVDGKSVITSGNISSQSVYSAQNAIYATSAGSASSATNASYATSSGSASSATNAYTLKSANDSYSTSHKSDNKLSSNATSGTTQLGSASLKWSEVFAATGTINTSDRNEKREIKELDDKYAKLFELLVPVSFQFKDSKSGRTHIGFISQDVEEAMEKVGLTNLDFAGFCKDIKEEYYVDEDGIEKSRQVLDENKNPIYIYSLRYGEFIALNTMMIQRANNRISELEKKYDKIIELLENK